MNRETSLFYFVLLPSRKSFHEKVDIEVSIWRIVENGESWYNGVGGLLPAEIDWNGTMNFPCEGFGEILLRRSDVTAISVSTAVSTLLLVFLGNLTSRVIDTRYNFFRLKHINLRDFQFRAAEIWQIKPEKNKQLCPSLANYRNLQKVNRSSHRKTVEIKQKYYQRKLQTFQEMKCGWEKARNLIQVARRSIKKRETTRKTARIGGWK